MHLASLGHEEHTRLKVDDNDDEVPSSPKRLNIPKKDKYMKITPIIFFRKLNGAIYKLSSCNKTFVYCIIVLLVFKGIGVLENMILLM